MAQLTLTQRSSMATSISLQGRLVAAVKNTAEYWKNFPLDSKESYNVAVKKKKDFARQILENASLPNIQAYAEYLLNQYQFDGDPDLEKDELSDAVLSDSTASAATYEYFAGVQPGDDTKAITF